MSRNLTLCLSFVGLLTALAGCGPKTVQTGPDLAEPIVFPKAPAQPRVQFLGRYAGARDIGGTEGGSFMEKLVGSEDRDDVTDIERPYGVTSLPGRILVCDIEKGDVAVFDFAQRRFRRLRPEELRKPGDCAADPRDGRLYVADVTERRVLVFSETGALVGSVGDPDRMRPVDVYVDDARILFSDMETHRIRVYDKVSLAPVTEFPEIEPDSVGGLGVPNGIATWGDSILVSDQVNFTVNVYSGAGEFLGYFGGLGDSAGQFGRPKGIAIGPDGVVYVVDARHQNVQMFNTDGQLLMWFGGGYEGPGDMYLPARVEVDTLNLQYFESAVLPGYELQYLILVTNQYGPDKLSIYGRIEPRDEADVP